MSKPIGCNGVPTWLDERMDHDEFCEEMKIRQKQGLWIKRNYGRAWLQRFEATHAAQGATHRLRLGMNRIPWDRPGTLEAVERKLNEFREAAGMQPEESR